MSNYYMSLIYSSVFERMIDSSSHVGYSTIESHVLHVEMHQLLLLSIASTRLLLLTSSAFNTDVVLTMLRFTVDLSLKRIA